MRSGRVDFGDGLVAWYNTNGMFHRTDGPALVFPDGDKYWYISGMELTFDEWCEQLGIDQNRRLLLQVQYG